MNAFKGKLGKLKFHRKHSHTEEGDSSQETSGAASPAAATSPPVAAAGVPPASTPPRAISPVANGAMPPQMKMMMKSGPPPPGAKIMKGPPPAGTLSPPGTFLSGGQGQLSPSRSISPSGLPPGAKVISGPPPPGAKIMPGPPGSFSPPPGAKIMSGSPPPGAKIMKGPPPQGGMPPGGGPVKTPPGVMMQGKKMMPGGPPPGAKIIQGMPPPGAHIMKGPPLAFSRPQTPEHPGSVSKSPVFSVMGSRPMTPEYSVGPNGAPVSPPAGMMGKKIMSGPLPPGAKLIKMPSGSPPLRSVSPPSGAAAPVKSPMKLQMRVSPARPGSAVKTPVGASSVVSQLVPMNGSFNQATAPGQGPSAVPIHRPFPVRSKVPVKSIPTPPPSALIQKSIGGAAKRLPPRLASSGVLTEDDLDFREEGSGESPADGVGGATDDDDIKFDESSPLDLHEDAGAAAPTKRAESQKQEESINFNAGSSNSSAFFKEEADLQTAPPPPGMANSVQSSVVPKTASSQSSRPLAKASKPVGKEARIAEPKKEHRHKREDRHRSKSSKGRRHHRRDRTGTESSSSSSDNEDAVDVNRKSRSRRASPAVEHISSSQDRDSEATGDGVGPGSSLVPRFSQRALSAATLTPSLRSRIADQFLSILCPQQYYGKVKKINGIRPLNADRAQATGLRTHNCIYVATKGVMPNQLFYPQLRLYEADGRPTVDDRDRGAYDTPIILYEAAPGHMGFAETELEAQRVLSSEPSADSCFVLGSSSILFRNPEQYVLPLAMLNVRWVPYASPQSEPQCPIHHKELQLFDPYSKELVCALCASKDAGHLSRLVVIPDVLNGDSRRKIHESISRQLDEAQRSAKMWVGQHQRINQLRGNKKEAVRQQFDLLAAAVESKRKEFLEACDAEYGLAQSDVAREILVSDERVQLLSAAADHLRTDATQPLYSMQIATIAEGLEASSQLPCNFNRSSLSVPGLSTSVMPNLEGLMTELQALSPDNPGAARVDRRQASSPVSHSPFQARRTSGTDDAIGVSSSQSPYRSANSRGLGTFSGGASRAASVTSGSARSGGLSQHRVDRRSATVGSRDRMMSPSSRRQSAGLRSSPPLQHSPHRPAPSPPSPASSAQSSRRNAGTRRQRLAAMNGRDIRKVTYSGVREEGRPQRQENGQNGDNSGLSDYRTDAVTMPNSTGTSLFDYPVDELLVDDLDGRVTTGRSPAARKQRVIQWTLRVEDPGDWAGIGVGVGTSIEAWERGRSNDLSHLWIVPGGSRSSPGERQVYQLRVTVHPTTGHARLSVHDARGKQVDDGSIPQWNATRVCYPQVTFGGRIGQVRMVEAPHIILL